ncbi:hypothetical protein M0C34_07665 [Agarivorans sp. TSD2052]|uniref:hypothetical protein n=1 Tax=Agarivorans sp. TSD2052 TaxID=2937286 RepID=UPI00200E8420|nr:hypothetical protein [Agarivorans sp. TSD2052]UPW20128.1 hypothetical protein M0C34_07665 [Agarivorans sp. TSD2052]
MNKWLQLPDVEARIAKLPLEWRKAVSTVLDNELSETRMHERNKAAILSALRHGEKITSTITKTLNGSLRDIYKDAQPTHSEIIERLIARPALCIFLYAHYGFNGEQEWINARPINQSSQARWSPARKKKAATLCEKHFDGLPSNGTLANHSQSELRALSQHLRTEVKRNQFCETYNLKRALKTRKQALHRTSEGKAMIYNCYLDTVKGKGRYVNDHQLSVNFKGEKLRLTDGTEIAPNTLRSEIKAAYETVEKLFLELIDDGKLPETMRKQCHGPVAKDGTKLDSWNEVHYYEILMLYKTDVIERGGSFWNVIAHPVIEYSHLKSDFLMGHKVYIEVLRHNLDKIYAYNPAKDPAKYRVKLDNRIEVYERHSLPYLLIEPNSLADANTLKAHFEKIRDLIDEQGVMNISDDVAVKVSNNNPAGTWFDKELRDKTIKKIIKLNTGSDDILRSGTFPPHRKISEEGYGGLLDWFKRECKDMQAVAIEHNTFCFKIGRSSQSKIRLPTADEFIKVMKYHKKRLGIENITRGNLMKMFGRKAVEHFIGENKRFKTTEEMKEHL